MRWRAVVGGVVGAVVVAAFGVEGLLAAFPYPYELSEDAGSSYVLVDRHGQHLREAVGVTGERAVWVDLDEMSPWLVSGTIAIEDRRFYRHLGIDPRGVARAVVGNVQAGHVVSGASTLSMQTARLHAHHPRSGMGKVWQALDGLRLERVADKDTILEQYLNRAPYGAGTVGVEAASQRTFGKQSKHLSLAEAALIAGLPQAPSAHHPFVSEDNAVGRQRQVLAAMLETQVITQDQYDRALAEPLVYRDGSPRPEAMHFTDAVLASEPDVGRVMTTLDRDLQRAVQRLATEHVAALRDGGLTQAAVVVVDNETCDVRAMVGSADWWSGDDGSVNGAMSRRQPGSTLKPWAYATAWEGDFDPASVVADIPTRYLGAGGALMRPQNYSQTFSGPVLMGEALARSLNVPAVRTANATGLSDILKHMQASGLSSLDQDAGHYGLGLVLGNGEVTPLEVAAGYAMFARGGVSCTPRFTMDESVDDGERVFSARTAALVTDVLSDEGLRARAFGANNPLLVGFPVAVKTGTSTNFRDSWSAGYTNEYTVVVWGGDFGGAPMQHLSGSLGAGPLFREVIREVALRGSQGHIPARQVLPDDVAEVHVCAVSGHTPGADCPTRRVAVPMEAVARPSCEWHQPIRLDRRNGLRASERCPSEHVVERTFAVLPSNYAMWQEEHGDGPPTRYSPLCPSGRVTPDAVVVVHPSPGDVFLVEPGYRRSTQSVELTAEVDPPVGEVQWLVDGREVSRSEWPYTGAWTLEPGEHHVVAVAGDRRSEPVSFAVR